MVNLIRHDFERSRWVPYLLGAMLGLGLLLWLPPLAARSTQNAGPQRHVISVLPDPFAGQKE
jgi:hypothetical protein